MNLLAAIPRPGTAALSGLAFGLLVTGLVLCGPASVHGQTESTRRRGQYLRTEVLRTDAEKTYSCTLAPTSGSYPALLFRRLERLKQQEVRIYEVVVEEKTSDAETGRDEVTYRVSPGDELRGETSSRETTRDLGPLADEPFLVNGISLRTNAAGLYVDDAQRLLLPFDDLSVNVVDLEVQHAEMGTVTARISRYLTLRWDTKRPDERQRLVQTDLLVSLGADFEPLTAVGREGLRLRVSVPETIRPGQEVTIRVEAINEGKRPVGCLVGRLFSRHPWLTGINVYLGNIPPAGSREFERLVRVPESAGPGNVYGVFGFWDILGTAKESAQALSCRIVTDTTPPAKP
jgi:hypothetical protein